MIILSDVLSSKLSIFHLILPSLNMTDEVRHLLRLIDQKQEENTELQKGAYKNVIREFEIKKQLHHIKQVKEKMQRQLVKNFTTLKHMKFVNLQHVTIVRVYPK
ncbi:unnamed protein product [Paramecium primaurelia]|uniref:Uncharacterized protein n=1 Tax=Paramecium primaurelia TaxID=5886 RepID=A0A8S1MT30_PARPR|nr:unnamed protein product [Paramecium primaurelia]